MVKLLKSCLSLCIVLTLVLSACSNGDQESSSADAPASEVVTLKWAYWIPEPTEFIEEFNENHSHINLEYDMIASDQYINVINTRLLADEGPDIIAPRFYDNYVELIESGQIVELTGEDFIQNYDEDVMSQLTVDGKVYGIPDSVLWYLVYYNKEIFEEYDLEVPTTWEEYMDVSAVLKENGVAPQIQGMKDSWQHVFTAIDPVITADLNDSNWYNGLATGESKFTDEVFVDAMERIESFLSNGYLHEATISVTFSQAWQMFCEGEAAMMQGGTYYSSQAFPENEPDFDFGVFTVPYNTEGQTPKISINAIAGNTVINADSDHVEDALEFFEYLSQPENLAKYSNATKTLSAGKNIDVSFSPETALYNDMFNNTDKIAVVKIPTSVSSTMGKLIQSMILGDVTAQEAAENLQKEFEAAN